MPGGTATETGVPSPDLKGSPENPAREPRKNPLKGRGSVGDQAFMDAVMIVAAAWLVILFLMYSLRHHNI